MRRQVYTSYMIQMAFVLFLWFLIQVSSAIIKISRHLRLSERPVLRAWRHRFPTGARLLHRIFHRHHAVLKHTLIEFHEAQCFFLIAAQLAILIAQGDAAVLGSYTLRSALQNMTTSYLVSTIGILPVVIAMWSLQMAHEFCACTMLLSVTTVALSEASMYKSKGLSVRGQMATVDYRGWPASCGGHAPPLIYCGLATEGTGPIAFPSAFLKASNPICLTIFGVTVLLWVRQRLLGLACVNTSAALSPRRLVSVMLTRPPIPPFLSHVVRPLTFCLKPLADCALFTAVVVSMQVFSQYTNLIDWKGWSFGQVVAVTLWFPVICKYCYWLCSESLLRRHSIVVSSRLTLVQWALTHSRRCGYRVHTGSSTQQTTPIAARWFQLLQMGPRRVVVKPSGKGRRARRSRKAGIGGLIVVEWYMLQWGRRKQVDSRNSAFLIVILVERRSRNFSFETDIMQK